MLIRNSRVPIQLTQIFIPGQHVGTFVIGICGGSASGKTTVAKKIIKSLNIDWVTLLSMDSFYKVLSPEQHEAAARNEYNFEVSLTIRLAHLCNRKLVNPANAAERKQL